MNNCFKQFKNWFIQLLQQPPRELVDVHNETYVRFMYANQPNEWANAKSKILTVHTDGLFEGDCDDFAATVAYLMPQNSEHVAKYTELTVPGYGMHAVCIYGDWVSDNLRPFVYHKRELKKAKIHRSFDIREHSKNGYKLKVL